MSRFSRRRFLTTASTALALSQAASGVGTTVDAAWKLPAKRTFRVIENVWVTMKGGARLGVRLWIPEGADSSPVPAVLESTPYGKRIGVRMVRAGWAAAFVPYGFAYAVADIRGSGESDGVLRDEYLRQEQDDNVEIIAWLARQPWCNGSVGMRGVSWGGFSALQVAALAPPALKAIVTQSASDNRFTDDAHYIGGSFAMDGGEWAGFFALVKVASPDPEIVGDERWRDMWMERLNASGPTAATWLSHQRYDSFWQQGSVAVDYSRVKCPVYAVNGQVDPYRDFVGRLLTHLDVPRLGLLGSWGHHPPHVANPGPGLDWVWGEVRWWTHWLKGEDTGIMAEPMFRSYLQNHSAPEVWPRDTPGRWVSERVWPSPGIRQQTFFLSPDGLTRSARAPMSMVCRSREILGLTKREWYVVNPRIDLAYEQTPDDLMSLVFDSQPLDADIEIVGNPLARIRVSSDQPVAKLAMRVNEVTPDGRSWNISYGVLNLTHRDGHEHPQPLQVGKDYDVEVSGYYIAHRFKKGSRIRIALSESLWPLVWPSPRPVTLKITTGVSSLVLPVRPMESTDQTPPMSVLRDRVREKTPQSPEDGSAEVFQTGPDAKGRVTIHKRLRDGVRTIPEIGVTVTGGGDWHMSITDGDPNSSVWRFEWYRNMKRGVWDTTVRSVLEISSTPDEFRVQESLEASERDKVVFRRAWDNKRKRDLA